MLSRFFINRPIFAAVVSLIITIGGGITMLSLPISQYPVIEPPTVTVSASYPGANARVVADTVAAPIEQQVNGVEGMIYMSSTSANDGSYTLTVTFETGTDLDMAQVLVQNRVAIAEPKLPEDVKRIGITTKKKSPSFALMVAILAKGGEYDDVYLANYATLNIKDELSRVPGAGDVLVLGADEYSMRIWLDPEKMKSLDLTTDDIVNAIKEQNVQVAAGTIGLPPAPKGQDFQYTVSVLGRLEQAKQFENIIVKTESGGRITRVKDLGRVELGAKSYNLKAQLNSKPTAMIQIFQLPGANVLDLANNVKARMKELSKRFPQGVEYVVCYDASDVVVASIDEIVETLFIAALLVVLTVFVFLQDWRATLIPAVTIPVSLIGTFAVMGVLGFSINTLSMFGLVLAIGIVVDDAIVVVENTARNIDESGLSPKEATILAMEEVTGPVIATTLVLMAVFIPTAFMGGITGLLYKQFALTIATATFFSSINALTLSPALCSLLLRKTPQKRSPFWRGFNLGLDKSTKLYLFFVKAGVRRLLLSVVIFLGICAAAYFGMITTPTGFVPEEDQGYLMVNVQLPDGASLQRTYDVVQKVNKIVENTPGVRFCIGLTGFSIINSTTASNNGAAVVVYENWDKRKTPELSQNAIVGHLREEFAKIQEGVVMAFLVPALPGIGVAGGFDMQLQDRGGLGQNMLQRVAYEIIQKGNSQKELVGLYTSIRANVPQIFVDVDRDKVKTLGVSLSTVFNTLQAYLGSSYVNDFNRFGRTYQVNIQADSKFRSQISDIKKLQVRNHNGDMLPLGTLADVRRDFGPQVINRYNMYEAASIKGSGAVGYSSGQALELMTQIADKTMPQGMSFQWTGISYQETSQGSQAVFIFAIAVVFVYLVLAAQYESWKIPMPVALAVPMALFGAFLALILRHMDNNVYTQIGLVLLIGLAAKNAILIVEFARENYEKKGMTIKEAAIEAAHLRFRPILMTAFSFILGVLPLVIASGAGAGSRQSLGTAVFGGMLAATIIGVVIVPPIYVIFQGLGEKRKKRKAKAKAEQLKGEENHQGDSQA